MTTEEPEAKRAKMLSVADGSKASVGQLDTVGVIDSNECMTFHLLTKASDGTVVMEEDSHFPPDMTHQLSFAIHSS